MVNNTIKRVVWDCETEGMSAEQIVETFAETDPDLIDKKHLKKLDKWCDKPALDPMTGHIVAIGYAELGFVERTPPCSFS